MAAVAEEDARAIASRPVDVGRGGGAVEIGIGGARRERPTVGGWVGPRSIRVGRWTSVRLLRPTGRYGPPVVCLIGEFQYQILRLRKFRTYYISTVPKKIISPLSSEEKINLY